MKLAKQFNHNFDNGNFELFDKNNNVVFFENKEGYCEQYTFDKKGREIYFRTCGGYCEVTKYKKNGGATVFVI